jgi:hypothetical protein
MRYCRHRQKDRVKQLQNAVSLGQRWRQRRHGGRQISVSATAPVLGQASRHFPPPRPRPDLFPPAHACAHWAASARARVLPRAGAPFKREAQPQPFHHCPFSLRRMWRSGDRQHDRAPRAPPIGGPQSITGMPDMCQLRRIKVECFFHADRRAPVRAGMDPLRCFLSSQPGPHHPCRTHTSFAVRLLLSCMLCPGLRCALVASRPHPHLTIRMSSALGIPRTRKRSVPVRGTTTSHVAHSSRSAQQAAQQRSKPAQTNQTDSQYKLRPHTLTHTTGIRVVGSGTWG